MDHLLSKDFQNRQVLNIPGLSHTLTYLLFSFERLVGLLKAPDSGAFFLPKIRRELPCSGDPQRECLLPVYCEQSISSGFTQ